MIQYCVDHIQQLGLRKPYLQRSRVISVLAEHNVESWFLYAYDEWRSRWHIWRGILWVIKNISRDGRVLETGCGCGWNLLWLAANGFTSLTGIDVDSDAIAAGNELAHEGNYSFHLRRGNALRSDEYGNTPFHLILALNWTYHVPEFDLKLFLNNSAQHLVSNGVLMIDIIDRSFDLHPKNRFLTSDWEKPENLRRQSEYLHRYKHDEIQEISESCGFRIVTFFSRQEVIPRVIYALARG